MSIRAPWGSPHGRERDVYRSHLDPRRATTATTRHRPADPAVLQRSITETLWDIRKATADRGHLAARRAEREMNALLHQFADCMITDHAG